MESSPHIHVGILLGEALQFNLAGKFAVCNQGQNIFGECRAEIHKNAIRVYNGDDYLDFPEEAIFIPCNLSADHVELTGVTIGIDFHWERKETQRFQGGLKLLKTGDRIRVINIIPVEKYLHSVISSEMNANSSLALLKAHAIISRSWVLAQIRGKRTSTGSSPDGKKDRKQSADEWIDWQDREDHEQFHVCADDHCQRYQGISRVQNEKVIRAVNETHGQILMYGEEICDARYSKACGGVTEQFENCWEPDPHPYLVSMQDSKGNGDGTRLGLNKEPAFRSFLADPPDAFCNTTDEKILSQVLNTYDLPTRDFYRWIVRYTNKELSDLIRRRSGMDMGDIRSLVPLERGASGRITRLEITGTKKQLVVGKELTIRRWLSESHLFSAAFAVDAEGDGEIPEHFILSGAGWGHGVGLCQIGAAVMGEQGYTHEEILQHYYKDVKIVKTYS